MRRSSLLFLVLGSLASIAAAGCSAAGPDDAAAATAEALGVGVPNPAGTYAASITLNGTGCPAGTYGAEISPDGKSLTVVFSDYELMLNPGQALQIRDCTLAIDLSSPSAGSFAVTSYDYVNWAMMDSAGMKVSATEKFYFKGNPVPAQHRADGNDVFEDALPIHESVFTRDLVWSPCASSSRLNVQTRVIVQNNQPKTGSAYVNVEVEDSASGPRLVFGLAFKSCDAPPPPPATDAGP